jgi:hypothetical protein
MEGNHLVGDVKVIRSPAGDMLNSLMTANVDVQYTLSGCGNVEMIDGIRTITNYQLRSIDVSPLK